MSKTRSSVPDSVDVPRKPLVARTEIRDVLAVRLAAEVHAVELPDEANVSLSISEPQYTFRRGELLIRVTHNVDFARPAAAEDQSPGEDVKFAEIHVTHVAVLEVDGDDPDPSEVDRLFVENTIFMIHPYARAAIQRLTAEVGLPPLTLPYMRRPGLRVEATTQTSARETERL
ncbi:hypothetical protein IU459_08155 [Nocardia amamiensis]|uniref:Preprotein translocase subunit SecB n=1 Tax=Nocardia amamiensis TaxID=404578 RepID=A0ABS0CMV0_9NOCA|nr:hypothetical protein [Nocardia amamiensis]MBF6297515.1 hypothetical protein [Nocardia amamiensis]